MATQSPGKGILFSGSVGSTSVTTAAFDVSQLQQMSFQMRTDGSNALSYTVQASNVPAQANDYGPPYRNDAVTSVDWATLQTGSVATNTGGNTGITTLSCVPYRYCRLILNASAATTTAVFAFGTGASS